MAWEIRIGPTAEPDLAYFDDQDELMAALFRWVETGPPGTTKRRASGVGYERGVPFYQDDTEEGIRVQYLVGYDPVLYVWILRLQHPPK